MKITNIEKLLPFGYLFLVLIGILKQSVFYNQFGINILDYSSLMDILISPISDLAAHPQIFFALLSFILFIYFTFLFLAKNYNKPIGQKFFKSNSKLMSMTQEEVQIHFGNRFLLLSTLGLLSFFLGIGIGTGKKVKEKIEQQTITYDYLLKIDQTEKQIYLLGVNNLNYIYLEKGNNNVKISPAVVVKSIEFIQYPEKKQ
ncbi:hypothetical protein HX004_12595 [Myroides sp. 1354]|uniref:hypothetical protein n=1 Tax=unclassified Myroides TaxID=2642485 RepID=UPI00257775C8|nr:MULTISPECIES: hypothetical protein [unclassified Myroides]MDM1045610.1 hypothetical protein [Myroides sp. R163-1]MDM1056612.1 hypothetical protein [Myroides sp. 1354]MDM1069740.1 hypothetical protein [Myroides sp. 1372]